MAYEFAYYPDPLAGSLVLKPDVGGVYQCTPYTHPPTGRQGMACQVPDTVPNGQGAALEQSAEGYFPLTLRGFLMLDPDTKTARLQVDDSHLQATGAPPPGTTPPPTGPPNPLDIINRVYAETHPQLWTHEGCGLFTENCARALHEESSPYWGHIAKEPGQNQYNGHAVDAVMLALNIPGTAAGIYDIIYSSVSAEAKPVFNMAGPPEYEKWYYPEGTASKAQPVFVLRVR
jgi:hypothetical protein